MVPIDRPVIALRNASERAISHRWLIGTMVSTEPELTIDYPLAEDSLLISLEAESRHGCFDTAHAVARPDRVLFTSPNAFTPNLSDNNRWAPRTQDVIWMELWIYNRAGHCVAHWEGLQGEWDGTAADGEPCPMGNYTYYARYRSIVRPNWVEEKRGSILLIR